MARSLPRRLLRIGLWVLGGIVTLFVILFLALQTDPAQRFLTRKAESFLQQRLDTDLGIERIGWRFPTAIFLQDVYLNTPDGDTLLRFQDLAVDLDMWELLRQRVTIDDVQLNALYARIVTTDSSSNYAFLLDAFTTEDTTSTTTVPDTSASPWTIVLDNTSLTLDDIDLYYQDDPAGLLTDIELGQLRAQSRRVDLAAGYFAIREVFLRDSDIFIALEDTETTSEPSEPLDLEILADQLQVERTSYRMTMDSLAIDSYIGSTNLAEATATVGQTIHFTAPRFQLADGRFALDIPAPEVASGIDYNHLDLREIQIDLADISYRNDSIDLRIDSLAAREQSGLALLRTEGTVRYHPQGVTLENFLLATSRSRLQGPEIDMQYDFAAAPPLDELIIAANTRGYLGIGDILLLAPQLADQPLLRDNPGERIEFDLAAAGDGRQLDIDRANIDGPGLVLRSSGTISYPFDTARLAGELQLYELAAIPRPLIALLPAGTLPEYIDWPQRITGSGTFSYRNRELDLNLQASENRVLAPLTSRLNVQGRVLRPISFPNTYLDLRIDTLVGTRPTFLAYLPPGSLPDGYQLPEYVRAEGSVTGPMDQLNIDLQLALPQGTTYANLNGQVSNALDPEELELDIKVSDLGIAQRDVRGILPDSLLPSQVRLPDLRIQGAEISGKLDDLRFSVPITSSNGNWQLDGRYNPRNLNADIRIEDLRAAEFFTGALGDTLASLDLQPISISAQLQGQLEPQMDLSLTANIVEAGRGELLDVQATVSGDTYQADFRFDHSDLAGTGNARYELIDSLARVVGELQLRRFDLQRWNLSEEALSASGNLSFNSTGLQLDSMDAHLELDDIFLRGGGATSYIDSFVVDAELFTGENAVRVRSDLLDANLTGQFQPDSIVYEISRFIQGYWSERIEQPDPVVYGKQLLFDLNLKNPRPLTRGVIPGLEEISPLRAEFRYREQAPELVLDAELDHLVYGGITYDGLEISTTGDQSSLQFNAQWANIILSEEAQIGRTRITGRNARGGVAVDLTVFAEGSDSVRHRLSLLADPEVDSTRIVMAPQQVINFNTWRVPENNLILLDSSRLTIQNWELSRNNQSLRLTTPQANNVIVSFDNFDLSAIGRFINTEEELISGRLDGQVFLDEVLADLGIRSDVTVRDLAYRTQPLGTLTAKVTSQNNTNFTVDGALNGAGNEVSIAGSYREGGLLDLALDIGQLQLASAEPFSLGYLQQTAGYLTGQVAIDGSLEDPQLNGRVNFQDAALAISLLGSRYRVGEQPIDFDNDQIRFNNFTLLDSLGNSAVMNGNVLVRSISDYAFDLRVRARDFLALNSTAAENELYYGYLVVDADVEIEGDIFQPEVYVTATPKRDSRLTYDYATGLAQQTDAGVSKQQVVRFVERFEWSEILRVGSQDSLVTTQQASGTFIQTNLSITDDLRIRVIIDPITNQEFSGRGEGDISFTQYPNGRQEMTGQIEMVNGTYDMVLENIQSYEFQIDPGSRVYFTGDVNNPQLDLDISTRVSTSPLPLVQRFNPESSLSGLRQRETFIVQLNLDGDLEGMQIAADITYPADEYGNAGFENVGESLESLRRDKTQMYTTALTLITFRSFVIPLTGGDSGNPDAIKNSVAGAVTTVLNNLVNQNLGFVELDFGVENYQTAAGEDNYNLRVSISKSFLNDRLIVNVDGVTNTASDETTGDAQTYLDNISVEYLLNESGNLRIKLFNDRDRNVFVGGNVLRFGGRLVFSKDFNKLRWFGRKEEAPTPVRDNPEEQ